MSRGVFVWGVFVLEPTEPTLHGVKNAYENVWEPCYPRNQMHKKNSQQIFSWRISKKVYSSACKFSIRMITFGLTNGRSKTGL